MGKSLRASTKKANRTALRAKVHQPVEDARTERLSARLLEIAKKPKEVFAPAEADAEMVEDGTAQEQIEDGSGKASNVPVAEKMEVDDKAVNKKTVSKPRSNSSKVQKKRRAKMVFAVGKKHGTRPSTKGYRGPGIR